MILNYLKFWLFKLKFLFLLLILILILMVDSCCCIRKSVVLLLSSHSRKKNPELVLQTGRVIMSEGVQKLINCHGSQEEEEKKLCLICKV